MFTNAEQLVERLFSDMDDRSGFDTGGLDAETLGGWKAKWIGLLDTALSRARAEALEETAGYHDRKGDAARAWLDENERGAAERVVASWRLSLEIHRRSAAAIRAIITTPAPVSIPVERVRGVLADIYAVGKRSRDGYYAHSAQYAEHSGRMGAAYAAARDLGVPLDAAQEYRCLRCCMPVTNHILHTCTVTP